ncbi:MAG: hypothetical protein ABWZ40_02850 [Caulobacterales bacterium]
MDWRWTLGLSIACIATYVFAGWRRARPSTPLKVRMAPWLAIQAIAAASLFMLAVHGANLAGFHTGQQQGVAGYSPN